jgi:hypothetical protein
MQTLPEPKTQEANEQNRLQVKGYTISPELFEKGFPAGGGPCTCVSTCCAYGVYSDVAERDRIIAQKEVIKNYMDGTQTTDETQWFDENETVDHDFLSGRRVGTRIINNKCAFLDDRGRCSLQVAAVGEGMHKWALKPMFCVLYPIEIEKKVVVFDPMLQEEEPCCTVRSSFHTPLFEGCREELIHLIGQDGYATIQEYYRRLDRGRAVETSSAG